MGADALGFHLLFWETIPKFGAGLTSMLLDSFGRGFRWGELTFNIYYNNNNLLRLVFMVYCIK